MTLVTARPSRRNDPHDVRLRILDAAVEVLVERGYQGTSTLEIQRRAGVSRGGLLHHYPSRDTLLLAAAQHLERRRLEAATPTQQWPDDTAARIDAAIDAISLGYLDGNFWASMELWLGARNHDDLAEHLLPAEVALGRAMRETADAFFGAEVVALPHYEELRAVLLTSLRGMAMTTAFDHRLEPFWRHVDKLKVLARALLLDAAAPAGGSAEERHEPPVEDLAVVDAHPAPHVSH